MAIISNIIDQETLRQRQLDTLKVLSDALSKTFGPYGSNTIKYMNDGYPRYTKDGHTVLSSIKLNGEIEQSVLADIEEETRAQAKRVGDSTTSVTILSHYIFESLCNIEKDWNVPPAEIVRIFKNVVNAIIDEIKSHGRPVELDDIYDIAFVSTNGDEKLSNDILELYKKYGFDIYVDVIAGVEEETTDEALDGMVLDCGYGDITLVNILEKNISELHNPKIYFFRDPIDTVDYGNLFCELIDKNIIKPFVEKKSDQLIPTVVICPHISRDYTPILNKITAFCQQSISQGVPTGLPLNIITNTTSEDQEALDDIMTMCGGREIKKYVDNKIHEADLKSGIAPTIKNIDEFAGSAEVVVSSVNKTKFVNPKKMRNEDGSYTDIFNSRIRYIESCIEEIKSNEKGTVKIYKLKKRLNSLKGRMVELRVGGITIADRDQARDLIEDAILNCRSAAKNGVGYGANFEGLRASNSIANKLIEDTEFYKNFTNNSAYKKLVMDIANGIYGAYFNISCLLYNYYNDPEIFNQEFKQSNLVSMSLDNDCPFDVRKNTTGDHILSSIDTDICVLNSISKIVTLMATANQFLLPTFNVNKY